MFYLLILVFQCMISTTQKMEESLILIPKTIKVKLLKSYRENLKAFPRLTCVIIVIIQAQNVTFYRGIWSPIQKNVHTNAVSAKEDSKQWLPCKITSIPIQEQNHMLASFAMLLSPHQVLINANIDGNLYWITFVISTISTLPKSTGGLWFEQVNCDTVEIYPGNG